MSKKGKQRKTHENKYAAQKGKTKNPGQNSPVWGYVSEERDEEYNDAPAPLPAPREEQQPSGLENIAETAPPIKPKRDLSLPATPEGVYFVVYNRWNDAAYVFADATKKGQEDLAIKLSETKAGLYEQGVVDYAFDTKIAYVSLRWPFSSPSTYFKDTLCTVLNMPSWRIIKSEGLSAATRDFFGQFQYKHNADHDWFRIALYECFKLIRAVA